MAFAPGDSPAQQPVGNDWIGKRVVPKYRGFTLKIENQVIDPKGAIEIYRVEQVNGPSLRLHATQLNGWAPADQVVPVEQAIEFFTDYIRSHPGDAYGYTMRAHNLAIEKKELDIALGDYNEAIRLDPTNAYAYNNRGNAWSERRNTTRPSPITTKPSGSIPSTLSLTTTAASPGETRRNTTRPSPITTRPSDSIPSTPSPTATAARLVEQEGVRQGDRRLQRGHPTRSQDARAYNNRGNAWRDKKEYDKAIADYNEAIRLDPKGRRCVQQPRQRLAREEGIRQGHRRFQRGHPTRSQECLPLTTTAATPGATRSEYDKAIADFNEAIRLDPNDAVVLQQPRHRLAGQEGIRQGDRRLQRGHPTRSEVRPLASLAAASPGAKKQEYDKAIADYDEAIRLDPNDALRTMTTAASPGATRRNTTRRSPITTRLSVSIRNAHAPFSDAAKFGGSRTNMTRPWPITAIRSDSIRTRAAAYNGRGNVRYDKKEYDKAIADYNEAIRLDANYALAHNTRAWLWATCPDAKYRDGKKAVQSATTACELSEWKDPDDLDTLAAAHAEANDFDSAVKWETKAIELLSDEKTKGDYRSRLKLYQEKKPYRETNP